MNTDGQLEYPAGNATEWHEKLPEVLKQDFTLTQPPQGGIREIELWPGADGYLAFKCQVPDDYKYADEIDQDEFYTRLSYFG